MDDRKIRLSVGSILHDVGKLLYRYNDGRNHSTSGYDFVKSISALSGEKDILDCIRYHHAAMIKNADVPTNALCYITYIADNIASFSDRRNNETGDSGFIRDISFESVFNILNDNHGNLSYTPSILSDNDTINFPNENITAYSESFYGEILDRIRDKLAGIEYTSDYLNSLSEIFEAYTSYIPSSTQTGEVRDISLYNHSKLTAAVAVCIYDYLKERGTFDFKTELFDNAERFYDKNAFILYSADISGIQSFIYNISSSGALKGLRSRSFYLEIIMESAVDELLDRLELTRNNVIYTGGGHAYILLPCTENVKKTLSEFEKELNAWFLDNFGQELFIGTGYCECSANTLRNKPEGSYREMFGEVSRSISDKKIKRYSAGEIRKLNAAGNADNERECSVCGRSDRLTSDSNGRDICEICGSLKNLSDDILDGEFFTVLNEADEHGIILPFGKYLIADIKESLLKRIKDDSRYVRSYCKNKMYSGFRLATKLWIGDYSAEKEFAKLAEKSCGIKHLAVLRADVDNLGQAFVSGFEDKYTTLSRTSELSKKLSMFFKHHINSLMRNSEFSITGKSGARNAVIIYSGGDDVFVVGGWDDVIGFAVDLHNALKKYTQDTLKISAGIGLYSPAYPLYAMAEETGQLEDISKRNAGKDSVTLFDESNCYHWDEFIDKVVREKLAALDKYLNITDEKGNAMLYNMLELIRRREEENRLNIARFAYYIARLAPDRDKCTDEEYAAYREFSGKLYSWIQSESDSRELTTAIYLYVYKNRNNSDTEVIDNEA